MFLLSALSDHQKTGDYMITTGVPLHDSYWYATLPVLRGSRCVYQTSAYSPCLLLSFSSYKPNADVRELKQHCQLEVDEARAALE